LIPKAARRCCLWGLLAALSLTACASANSRHLSAQTAASPKAQAGGAPPSHIAVIVMENEEYGDILGSRAAPYINALGKRYATAVQMYAIAHPSVPNYLALTGGSTFGIDSDCTDCSVKATSIVDQMQRAHLSWKAYMEDLPHPCYGGAGSGNYAKKHDPFLYYTRVAGDPVRCGRVISLARLGADERARVLPTFIWITPNLCHDMHDCGVGAGDRFLAKLVPPLLHALGSRGLLVLTWDEGASDNGCCARATGGHVATILAGGLARRGARLDTPVDHYSVLQTIEDLLGLPRLRGAACACTPSLQPLLARH